MNGLPPDQSRFKEVKCVMFLGKSSMLLSDKSKTCRLPNSKAAKTLSYTAYVVESDV